jgi:hypothetical protein
VTAEVRGRDRRPGRGVVRSTGGRAARALAGRGAARLRKAALSSGGRSRDGDGPGVDDGVAGLDRLDAGDLRALVRSLAGSARRAGRGAVVSGRWLADTVVDLAPRVPVRDAETLSAHHDGLTGAALARDVVRSAGRVSGGIAAATGGLIAAQQVSVAGLVVVPFELAAETALVVLVELKLVAELHQIGGRPLGGGPLQRSGTAVAVWLSGHAAPASGAAPAGGIAADDAGAGADADGAEVDGADVIGAEPDEARPGGSAGLRLGRGARRELAAALRRRFTHNLATLGPMLTGAAAGGYLNRRATLSIGNRVARDLGLR